MKTKTRKSSKTTKTLATKVITPKAPKAHPTYQGAPIQATRLYMRKMEEFKNTDASMLLAVNNDSQTTTYLNTYRGGELPASYNPAHYTYPIKNAKKLEAKIAEMIEVEVTDWPPFVVRSAPAKRKLSMAREPGKSLDHLLKHSKVQIKIKK